MRKEHRVRTVQLPFLEVFNCLRLYKALSNLAWPQNLPFFEQNISLETPCGLFQAELPWVLHTHISPRCWMNCRATQFCPAVSPADPLKSQQCVQAITLALTSQVFLWDLGQAGSGRDIYPVLLAFQGHCSDQTANDSLDLYGSPKGGCGWEPPPQVWEWCCSAGPPQRMFYWGGCFLPSYLGLWSESCWPALTHKGLSLIIFCLGKLLLLSQLIYLYLPNEHFTFSSGQKSERKCFGFSHQKILGCIPWWMTEDSFLKI